MYYTHALRYQIDPIDRIDERKYHNVALHSCGKCFSLMGRFPDFALFTWNNIFVFTEKYKLLCVC